MPRGWKFIFFRWVFENDIENCDIYEGLEVEKFNISKIWNRINNFGVKELPEEKMDYYVEQLLKYKEELLGSNYYEMCWRKIRTKYKNINLYSLEYVSIGETVVRLTKMVEDFKKEDEQTLNVVLPVFFGYYHGGIFNSYLIELFGRKLYLVDGSNVDLWLYIMRHHKTEINTRSFHKYVPKTGRSIPVPENTPFVSFTGEEIRMGEKHIREMGINGEFICIHARDNGAKKECFNEDIAWETAVRNVDINTYTKACNYMSALSVQSVRMGKYEKAPCEIQGCIDYANKYYDEFMDFYLLSRCKFILGCASGLTTISSFWGRPHLETNAFVLNYGYESVPYNEKSMYIPKKFWSDEKKRYLNLWEVMDIVNQCNIYASNFKKKGIRIEDNTEEEIFNAVREMNSRLDGTWVETDEECKCREKYCRIMNEWREKHSFVKCYQKYGWKVGYTSNPNKICWSYLKDNMYLLDYSLKVEV